MNPKFKYIARLLQKLPGVGQRQAARFVLALLAKDERELQELGAAIATLKESVRFCKQCFNVSDEDFCGVCSSPKRDTSKLLIVEKITDLDSIEKTGLYRGLYHVLGGAISPVDGVTPDHLTIQPLLQRIQNSPKALEVILATNTSTQGETTALYLHEILSELPDITLTRLARGLSSGVNLEFADEMTLKNALDYRK